ncbi:MAG TPA: hypothetical protein DCL42_04370 [Deltaproteobacteria bacterium]|nr:hypothetical protein [Deltaproteobacteria bacterium]
MRIFKEIILVLVVILIVTFCCAKVFAQEVMPGEDYKKDAVVLNEELRKMREEARRNKNYIDDEIAALPVLRVKVGQFSRDMTTASGTQAVTGVGFQPKGIILVANRKNQPDLSIGFDDGSKGAVLWDNRLDTTADTYTNYHDSGSHSGSIQIVQGSSNNYNGYISSFDTDGFTVTWTKNASPTGTLDVNYMAFE